MVEDEDDDEDERSWGKYNTYTDTTLETRGQTGKNTYRRMKRSATT